MDFPLVFSILLWISIPILAISRRHKLLFIIAVCSFYTEIFNVQIFNFKFVAASWIAFSYLVCQKDKFLFDGKSILIRLFIVELFLMAVVGYYFVFFNPWIDPNESQRLPTQRLPLRTTVGLIRFFEIYLYFSYFYFIFKKKYVSLDFLLKLVFYLLLISVVIGLFDAYVSHGLIRLFLMPNHYALSRFTGLTGEPRVIGQLCTYSIFIFIVLGLNNKKKNLRIISYIGIPLAFLGIGASFSSTAIGYTFICLFIFFLFGQLPIKYLLSGVLIGVIGFFILKNNDDFVEHQKSRIAVVALEQTRSSIEDVPSFFNAFEVFDKSAATFLYKNPKYTWLGVGPNTINIPSSEYLSEGDKQDFNGAIDSVPINFVINLISRSGYLGILLYFFFFIKTLSALKKHEDKKYFKLFLIFLIYQIFYLNYFFYAISGMIMGIHTSLNNNIITKTKHKNIVIN